MSLRTNYLPLRDYCTCQSSLSAHWGRSSEICSTSLSPRPDKHYRGHQNNPKKKQKFQLTKTTSASFGKVLAIWVAPQTACADSRARRESVDQVTGGISLHAWNNAFKLGAHSKSAEGFLICRSDIFCPPRVFQPCMFRPYARVVETSTD